LKPIPTALPPYPMKDDVFKFEIASKKVQSLKVPFFRHFRLCAL